MEPRDVAVVSTKWSLCRGTGCLSLLVFLGGDGRHVFPSEEQHDCSPTKIYDPRPSSESSSSHCPRRSFERTNAEQL